MPLADGRGHDSCWRARYATIAAPCLDRRTRYAAVRTEHATVARLGLEQCLASRAFVKPLAGVGGHDQQLGVATGGASQQGFQFDCHIADSNPGCGGILFIASQRAALLTGMVAATLMMKRLARLLHLLPQTPPGLPLSGEEMCSPSDKGELEGVWGSISCCFTLKLCSISQAPMMATATRKSCRGSALRPHAPPCRPPPRRAWTSHRSS